MGLMIWFIFFHKNTLFHGEPGYLWQQSICWTFIFLSGMCFSLGRHPVKRGLILTGCGLIITLVTVLVMPESIVIMGVLNFFGFATLITAFLQPLLRRIPAYAGIPVSFLLFLLTREVPSGYLGFEGLRLAALPRFLYQGKLMMVLGFPYDGFYSTDYFSVIPWLFCFLPDIISGSCWNAQTAPFLLSCAGHYAGRLSLSAEILFLFICCISRR